MLQTSKALLGCNSLKHPGQSICLLHDKWGQAGGEEEGLGDPKLKILVSVIVSDGAARTDCRIFVSPVGERWSSLPF